MKAENKHPFEILGPLRMLEGLESLGFFPDGRMLALNSFENRVYLFWLDEPWVDEDGEPHHSLVLKAYRPGRWSAAQILEEHQFAIDLSDAELPVPTPIDLRRMSHRQLRGSMTKRAAEGPCLIGNSLLWLDPVMIALWPRQGGRAPDMDRPEVLERMGRFIARLHRVGRERGFEHRLGFRGLSSAYEAIDQVAALSRPMPEACDRWRSTARQCLDLAQRCVQDLPQPKLLRLHGDMHWGNVLWTESGPHFVDLDDCRMGPAIADLWPLLSGQGEELACGLELLLQAYRSISELDASELHWIEVMRSMRLIEHAAWIANRYDDPAFPPAFPGFTDPDFWDRRMVELQQQQSVLSQQSASRKGNLW
ncbi:MAG: serine/threonine protein kinase [Betaproteobacteria bacterium]|nr:serine/threonine protein kinase [Betaproteobacteria bacterium]NBO43633.1 serine/threonine protein kinase [Betaproteobacteria bacterium]NBP10443.1 serine/threonine protein kinase [Betaproteobacteria bacterium]NBP61043.1 serine/threonine protein kinase [Betaproteobacteria bacterium]NBQ08165.1 serine/threonine protein kinase [Betaproteobacteria bacterium]